MTARQDQPGHSCFRSSHRTNCVAQLRGGGGVVAVCLSKVSRLELSPALPTTQDVVCVVNAEAEAESEAVWRWSVAARVGHRASKEISQPGTRGEVKRIPLRTDDISLSTT